MQTSFIKNESLSSLIVYMSRDKRNLISVQRSIFPNYPISEFPNQKTQCLMSRFSFMFAYTRNCLTEVIFTFTVFGGEM